MVWELEAQRAEGIDDVKFAILFPGPVASIIFLGLFLVSLRIEDLPEANLLA